MILNASRIQWITICTMMVFYQFREKRKPLLRRFCAFLFYSFLISLSLSPPIPYIISCLNLRWFYQAKKKIEQTLPLHLHTNEKWKLWMLLYAHLLCKLHPKICSYWLTESIQKHRLRMFQFVRVFFLQNHNVEYCMGVKR